MDGDRIALVLDDDAGAELLEIIELLLEGAVERYRAMVIEAVAFRHPDFGAVPAHGREAQRCEDAVDIGERSPADEGDGAVEFPGQPLQRLLQEFRNDHLVRARREVEQCAVDIEKDRHVVERHERHDVGVVC